MTTNQSDPFQAVVIKRLFDNNNRIHSREQIRQYGDNGLTRAEIDRALTCLLSFELVVESVSGFGLTTDGTKVAQALAPMGQLLEACAAARAREGRPKNTAFKVVGLVATIVCAITGVVAVFMPRPDSTPPQTRPVSTSTAPTTQSQPAK